MTFLAWPLAPVPVGYNVSHSCVNTADSAGSNGFFVVSEIEVAVGQNRGVVEVEVTNLDHR